jgi:predicted metal-dependent hydrolase
MPNITVKASTRARQLRITVNRDGTVYISKPRAFSTDDAFAFARKHMLWIKRQILRMSRLPKPSRYQPGGARRTYAAHKEEARAIIAPRLAHFATLYGVSVKRVSVRNQKSRWGSCSRNGNVSINYKVAFLPEHLRDYILVHEICHLIEFNHGRAFWSLVERQVPDYKALRQELKAQ